MHHPPVLGSAYQMWSTGSQHTTCGEHWQTSAQNRCGAMAAVSTRHSCKQCLRSVLHTGRRLAASRCGSLGTGLTLAGQLAAGQCSSLGTGFHTGRATAARWALGCTLAGQGLLQRLYTGRQHTPFVHTAPPNWPAHWQGDCSSTLGCAPAGQELLQRLRTGRRCCLGLVLGVGPQRGLGRLPQPQHTPCTAGIRCWKRLNTLTCLREVG
mmetsp:Transcript_38600/g.114629  ORF Transcript_38600/g.114629 Transcript_38600/m.114629 type:complete len:210 (+) Transcript_38600:381-1010(+)